MLHVFMITSSIHWLHRLCIFLHSKSQVTQPVKGPSMVTESDSTYNESRRTKKTQQNPKSAQDSKPLPDLPPEIIHEILLRLPVTSLLQFRSVCKLWRSLISTSQFVKAHLNLASKRTDYSHQKLVLSCVRPYFNLKSCSLLPLLNEQSSNAVELDYPMKDPHKSVWIVGSCNGLLCFAIDEDAVFLWNPSTRKSKRLTCSGIRMRYGYPITYGFGYDESIDDYKVVGIFGIVGSGGSYETEVKVYTMGTNSWRKIGDFPRDIPLDDSGKFANGKLHWAASADTGSSYSWVIVSLDLAKETYGEVPQPSYDEGDSDLTLGVLNGCICALSHYPGAHAEVWIMNEYGRRESWTKLVAIPYPAGPGHYEYLSPIWLSNNGEILLELGSQLGVYNPKDGTFRYPTIHNLCGCFEVATYAESLVLLDADNVFQREEQ